MRIRVYTMSCMSPDLLYKSNDHCVLLPGVSHEPGARGSHHLKEGAGCEGGGLPEEDEGVQRAAGGRGGAAEEGALFSGEGLGGG